ncbi:MAG: hypothetical protein ACRDRT_13035, partial [Pseudonocardiaceae bacterium]
DGHFVPLAVADQSIFTRVNEATAATRPGGELHAGVRTAHPDNVGRTPAGQFRQLTTLRVA